MSNQRFMVNVFGMHMYIFSFIIIMLYCNNHKLYNNNPVRTAGDLLYLYYLPSLHS